MKDEPPWSQVDEPRHITRIRIQFAAGLPDRVRKIEELYCSLSGARDDVPLEVARNFFQEVHQLAGSAGALGAHRIGEIAARIDFLVRHYHDERSEPPREVIEEIEPLLCELIAAEKKFLRWMGESADPPDKDHIAEDWRDGWIVDETES